MNIVSLSTNGQIHIHEVSETDFDFFPGVVNYLEESKCFMKRWSFKDGPELIMFLNDAASKRRTENASV